MHGLRLTWSVNVRVSEKFIRKMMQAEKIYVERQHVLLR